MKPLEAITTVYSYYLPEVRELVSRIAAAYPHEVFLRSVSPGLDDFHEPVLDSVVALHADDVPGLPVFSHRYPTAGSEEGIREYMSELALRGAREILMFRGDYEGYREVARSRGLTVREVDPIEDPADVPPGDWFLSNPSARDGNVIPDSVIHRIADAGHRIFYDLSYLGSTDPVRYPVDHPNVAAVAISFSKTYGLFYSRIGFLFTRKPVTALYGNRWFKNIFSLIVARAVATELDTPALAGKYKAVQKEIVADIAREHGLDLRPSDAFLLAHLPVEKAEQLDETRRKAIDKYRRARDYRFCLTPYFLARCG